LETVVFKEEKVGKNLEYLFLAGRVAFRVEIALARNKIKIKPNTVLPIPGEPEITKIFKYFFPVFGKNSQKFARKSLKHGLITTSGGKSKKLSFCSQ
jgi:hypothetical protein